MRITGVLYRAIVGGRVWIETKSQRELAEVCEGVNVERYERIVYVETTEGWQPWTPEADAPQVDEPPC